MTCDEIRRTISDADGRLLRSRRVRAHLRECTACATFAAAITTRQRELRALVPALPAAAATGLLWRVAGAGSTHGTGSGMAGLAIGGAGKTAGAALAANALAGVAVVASATVGVTLGVDRLAQSSSQARAGRHGTPSARSVAAPHRPPVFAVSPASGAVNLGAHPSPRLTRSSAVPRTTTPRRAAGRKPNSAAAAAGAGASPARTVPGHATGSASPISTSPGHSGAAPGHAATTSTSPGHSGAAPGHAATTSTSPGHSGAASGHAATTSTSPGHSGAPGQSSSASGDPKSDVVAVPSASPLPSLPVAPAVTHGASATAPGHLK